MDPSHACFLAQKLYDAKQPCALLSSSCMELKQNTTIVVLGASGDLAKKKTVGSSPTSAPPLMLCANMLVFCFMIYRNQFLPQDVKIVGYARTKMDHEEYIRRIKSYMKTPTKESEQQLEEFCQLCTYVSGQYDKDESFQGLEQHLQEIEKGRAETHRLFYMALPPSVFTIVSQHLKKICYPTKGIARVIVEKPFGKDLASSRELQKSLEPDWNEQELFRIDHYLGKEMVKNILILRFGNSFLGATWNRHHIDNVQITFKEPFGTEGRGGYFDEFGIVRDVMQNHLLQVLTLLAMERPISFNAEDIRDEKVRVLRAIPAIEPKNVIIGQYGKSLDGSKPAYREDDTVPKDSRCPTFCALVAYIKNERWDGVPFIMKAGKALNEQKTEIRIQFKDVTSGIFKDIPRNELVMRIQPNESVYIKMNSKLPGLSMQTVVTELDLTYRRRFSDLKIPEAYESLVLDCLKGDQSNFVRDDELDASWRVFTPLLHYLDDNKEIIPMEYPYGSRGPAVLDDFTASYGYKFSDAAGYQWPTTTATPNKLPGTGGKIEKAALRITAILIISSILSSPSRDRVASYADSTPLEPLNTIANSKLNGVNGAGAHGHQNALDKGKAVAVADAGNAAVNGAVATAPQTNGFRTDALPTDEVGPRMNDLPDEILHITRGYVSLSTLLTRMAQYTHNQLQEKIVEMAKMPVPATAMNGNSSIPNNDLDDTSSENLSKKKLILNFALDEHRKWVKALVIAEWSRKAEMVSKLIDLRFHIQAQQVCYDTAFDTMVNVKRDLTFARMPSPDLKTALQVLSTGKAAWMPDLQYIEPPPLTLEEQIQWMSDVNTLLSLRLNLEDFDKIPYQFRNYEIDSGRVTFKVPGEFEVDLTIADEDFEKQFWFIDFRFTFTPSASSIPESLKNYLEGHVNDVLSKDGLLGCYQFLHEFVLTHKLTELRRQATQLSKSSWTGTLKVEALNRALAIQYWTSRAPPTSPKSWVLVAVNSGRKANGQTNPKSSTHLTAKWYRDNKEVSDVDIPFDSENLSAETLLKTVIGRHIDFLLSSIHNKLQTTPRFRNREAAMVLRSSQLDPAASSLTMRVGYKDSASLLIEPTTGVFAVKPHSKFTIQHELQLNNGKNPADDGVTCLENVRCGVMEDELNRRGSTLGWSTKKCPLNNEELRSVTRTRDWTKTIWLQRAGWGPNWYVMVMLSLSGDEWWLLEVDRSAPGQAVKLAAKLPLNKGYPHLNDGFWNNLMVFATGMIVQAVDMRELHRHHIKCRPNEARNWSLPQQVRLPSIEIALSGIFPSMVFDSAEKDGTKASSGSSNEGIDNSELASIVQPATALSVSTRQPWANDIVSIRFKGVQPPDPEPSGPEDADPENAKPDPPLTCVSDAIIRVRRPAKFTSLRGTMVGRDVSYNPRKGEFCLRMRHSIGQPIMENLKSRVKAVDRFVSFVESMDKAKGSIRSEAVSLKAVVFSYGNPTSQPDDQSSTPPRLWRVALDLSKDDIDIKMETGNPHLRVVDLMQNLVNSDGGIEALMAWLPASLPALEAIQKMEESWADIEARNQGRFTFSMNSVDWMTFQYSLTGSGSASQMPQRQIAFEGRMKSRRGEPWWHIWRAAPGNDTSPPDDEFTPALKPVWEGRGEDWNGLATSAAGGPSRGVVGVLMAIDGAIRPLAGTSTLGGTQVVVLE
ncbi:hypothetical protein FDECE_1711 [Fusarium decemcellulare]|nr:hypothetical protein FDECE_1711 [Fusarium decemcellulare]